MSIIPSDVLPATLAPPLDSPTLTEVAAAPASKTAAKPKRQRKAKPKPTVASLAGFSDWPDAMLVGRPVAALVLGTTEATLAAVSCESRWDLRVVKMGRACRYEVGELRRFIAARVAAGRA